MHHYLREDGRYYYVTATRDLLGPVVMIAHGGALSPRVRSIPVDGPEEAERLIARIGRTRRAHGYRLAGEAAPTSPS